MAVDAARELLLCFLCPSPWIFEVETQSQRRGGGRTATRAPGPAASFGDGPTPRGAGAPSGRSPRDEGKAQELDPAMGTAVSRLVQRARLRRRFVEDSLLAIQEPAREP